MAEKKGKRRRMVTKRQIFGEVLVRYPLLPVFGRYDSLLHILLYVCVR